MFAFWSSLDELHVSIMNSSDELHVSIMNSSDESVSIMNSSTSEGYFRRDHPMFFLLSGS